MDATQALTLFSPFGAVLEGRSWSAESGYRYGFNGKVKDNEGMGGGGQTYDYGFRIYNPSLAKFLSVDPLSASYPWYTPYQFAGNKPIWAIDLDGLEEFIVTDFYNSTGQLYQTTIQVVSALTPSGTQDRNQIVHYNTVNFDADGNAICTYVGSVSGTRAPANGAPSSALRPEINTILYFNISSPAGTIVESSSAGVQTRTKEVVIESILTNGANNVLGFGRLVTPNGMTTIDWTTGTCADSPVAPPSPSPGVAPNGIAVSIPDPMTNAYLPEDIHASPADVNNLRPLTIAQMTAYGIAGASPTLPVNSARFKLESPSEACAKMSDGSKAVTFNSGAGGITYPENSQATPKECKVNKNQALYNVTIQ
jgi:RHS repeat-associated protein